MHVCIALGPNEVSSYARGVLISGCPHLGVPLHSYVHVVMLYLTVL